ncbi:hypothetical protein E2C01_005086 [Portunus trituberculatus]|uniref:Uncharacterized protein n=1 Tax=Portunus trituberculatus TaxID=210409 RepID=A0A5B7CVP3_PORTR|nr:hypothetical protein [Portunus trituberculatus]
MLRYMGVWEGEVYDHCRKTAAYTFYQVNKSNFLSRLFDECYFKMTKVIVSEQPTRARIVVDTKERKKERPDHFLSDHGNNTYRGDLRLRASRRAIGISSSSHSPKLLLFPARRRSGRHSPLSRSLP